MDIRRTVHAAGKLLKRHLPDILEAAGIIGVGVTAALAVNAGWKLNQLAQEYDDMAHPPESPAKDTAVILAPVVACCAVSVACIAGGNHIHRMRYQNLGEDYRKLHTDFAQYQAAVVGLFGGEAHQAALAAASEKSKPEVIAKEPDVFTFYDKCTGETVNATLMEIMERQDEVRRKICDDGYLDLKQYCAIMGLYDGNVNPDKSWDGGEMYDWSGSCWLWCDNIPHDEPDGERWYSIELNIYPTVDGVLDWDDYRDTLNLAKNTDVLVEGGMTDVR